MVLGIQEIMTELRAALAAGDVPEASTLLVKLIVECDSCDAEEFTYEESEALAEAAKQSTDLVLILETAAFLALYGDPGFTQGILDHADKFVDQYPVYAAKRRETILRNAGDRDELPQ